MSLGLKTKMHFIPPQPGSFEEMRKYLDAGTSEVLGGWGQKERKAWIRDQLLSCQYEHLGRREKGLVRQFLQNVTGYSRAQIAREIAAYRRELQAASGESQVETKGLGLGLGGGEGSEALSCAPSVVSSRQGLGEGDQGDQSDRSTSVTSARSFWKRVRRFVLISSLITNIAFVAMLLSMSLWERAEKAREKNPVLALPPAIETREQPVHAAPSYAPMP